MIPRTPTDGTRPAPDTPNIPPKDLPILKEIEEEIRQKHEADKSSAEKKRIQPKDDTEKKEVE